MKSLVHIFASFAVRFAVGLVALGVIARNVSGAEDFAVVAADHAYDPKMGGALEGHNSLSGQALQYVIPGPYLTALGEQSFTGLGLWSDSNHAPNFPGSGRANFSIQLNPCAGDSLSPTFGEDLANPALVLSSQIAIAEERLLAASLLARPQGPELADWYWSLDAALRQEAVSDTAGILSEYLAITEHTATPFAPNGMVIPEPNPLAFVVLGLMSFFAFYRQKN